MAPVTTICLAYTQIWYVQQEGGCWVYRIYLSHLGTLISSFRDWKFSEDSQVPSMLKVFSAESKCQAGCTNTFLYNVILK